MASKGPVDRTDGRLDRAVLAYRSDPSEENRLALLAAGEEHNEAFLAEQTSSYIERTRGNRGKEVSDV